MFIEDICLDTRDDLIQLLKESKYEYIILKFTAKWCNPCKIIQPYVETLIEEKIKMLNQRQKTNVLLYVEVDVDICFDLYSFMKKHKRLNGIPSLLLYDRKSYSELDDSLKYIPQMTVSGTNKDSIKRLIDCVQ